VLALGLSISLFVYWGVVGIALLALLHTQRNLLQNLLLAPVVGAAAPILAIFSLSRAGLKIATVEVSGRRTVNLRLPLMEGRKNLFRLHVEGGGSSTPNDPRTLNFRVFRVG